MDEEYVERRPGDMEAYRRIDAYAHVRLAPDAAAMARIRSALVAEATLRAVGGLEDVTAHAAAIPMERPLSIVPPRPRASRVATALLAAALGVGMLAGSVAASTAGGPLYGTRLWIEEMTLPASGVARGEAQVARLDARLAEVRAALASGNGEGAEAALEAYVAILAQLEAQAEADPAVALGVTDDVSRHLEVLEALVGHVPPQAQDALRHALDRSDTALDHLGGEHGPNPDQGSGKPANPGANGNGTPGGPGGPGAPTDKPDASDPRRTPPAGPPSDRPERTPKPDPTATSTDTPEPEPVTTPEPTRSSPAGDPSVPPRRTPPPRPDRTAEPGPHSQPDRTPRGGGPTKS